MAKKPYNGHESWTAWNVSLWIANDEPTYRMALDYLKSAKGRAGVAAARMLKDGALPTRTPDGAKYSAHAVSLALRDLA